jgi:hypothetical protein
MTPQQDVCGGEAKVCKKLTNVRAREAAPHASCAAFGA